MLLLDINKQIKEIKNRSKFEDFDLIIEKGVVFCDIPVKITKSEYQNHFNNQKNFWYFFECPNCKTRVKKLFFYLDKVVCNHCSNIKIKRDMPIKGQRGKIFRLKRDLTRLFQDKDTLSVKKKRLLINNAVRHFEGLEPRYKMAYNTLLFKELLNWCAFTLQNKDKTKEYKDAVRDVLAILKSGREILIKAKLADL